MVVDVYSYYSLANLSFDFSYIIRNTVEAHQTIWYTNCVES